MTQQPRAEVTYFRNSNFKHKVKRLQIPQKLVCKVTVANEFYVHENAVINLLKIYFL